MSPLRKRLFGILRLAICVVALWFLGRGVTLEDRVVLADGTTTLAGAISVLDGDVLVTSSGGELAALSPSEVAVDENGSPRISFGLATSWRHSGKFFLFAAIAVFAFVPVLSAWRIRRLLRSSDVEIGFGDALKLTFAGNFLNFAAPLGSTAGDVFKAYYLSRCTERKTEAMATVFIDRIVGLGSLVVTVSLITILSPPDGRLAPLRMYMMVLLSAGAVGAIAYFSPWLRRIGLIQRLAARLPMSYHLRRIDRTALRIVARPRLLVEVVGVTVTLQILAAGSFLMVAIALGLTAGAENAMEFYAYFSTGEIIKALPGPPQGLGTMELAYGYFFAPFGSASQILCAAFAIRVVMLICALPGLLVTAAGACRPSVERPCGALVTA